MSFYIYLPWNDSSNFFSNNSISNFKVKLPKFINCNLKFYEVALVEIKDFPSILSDSENDSNNLNTNQVIKRKNKTVSCTVFFHCDIIEPQIYGSTFCNLLRSVYIYDDSRKYISIESPFYVPISRVEFNTIHIRLCDSQGAQLNLKSSELENLTLTLHVRERRRFHRKNV